MQAHRNNNAHFPHHADDEPLVLRRGNKEAAAAQKLRDLAAGLRIPVRLERKKDRCQPILRAHGLRRRGKALLPFLKARPRAQHIERIGSIRRKPLTLQEALHRAGLSRLKQERRVCGNADIRLYNTHRAKLRKGHILAQRDGVHAAVDDPRRHFPVACAVHGADAAAVHQDAVPGQLCKADAPEIIPERAAARLILNEAAAAGQIELRPSHDVPESKRVEHMHRADIIFLPCLDGVMGKHIDRHIFVDVLHLPDDCL